MRAHANAWPIGDLGEIRTLNFDDRANACVHALSPGSLGRNQPELKTAQETALAQWVAAAEKALATNPSRSEDANCGRGPLKVGRRYAKGSHVAQGTRVLVP